MSTQISSTPLTQTSVVSPPHPFAVPQFKGETINNEDAWAVTRRPDEVGVPVAKLEGWIHAYFQDCELRLLSRETIEGRKYFYRNFLWFLNREGIADCTSTDIRRFFYYLGHGHEESGGRFGKAHLICPLRPITIRDYYNSLRLLFEWLYEQGVTAESLFKKINPPVARTGIKQPLSEEQIEKLIIAARSSSDPLRNCAMIAFFLDTGCRASEVISLRIRHVDLANGRCQVLGKGNKLRTVFFGQQTSELLKTYLDKSYDLDKTIPQDWPIFYSGLRLRIDPSRQVELLPNDFENGHEGLVTVFRDHRGNLLEIPPPLSRYGMLRLMKRIAKKAGIKDDVCLHAFRRTFAIEMLRSGAHVFGVQELLGHTDLGQTRKYCAVALSDAEAQHRKFSPVDRQLAFAQV